MVQQLVKKAFRAMGIDIRRASSADYKPPVEFSRVDLDVFRYVTENKLTMVSPEGVAVAITACKYAAGSAIEGDFVECGVWRGGVSIAAKMIFEAYGSDKKVWLFDTFAGMTEPTDVDRGLILGEDSFELFKKNRRKGHVDWCYASLESVRGNFERAGVDLGGVRFIKGDVCETLGDERYLPEAISVLRLDTDFYESTKKELEVLYPRLSPKGTLLIDDFGYWEGARKAVEEYFELRADRPLLFPTDRCTRAGVKP